MSGTRQGYAHSRNAKYKEVRRGFWAQLGTAIGVVISPGDGGTGLPQSPYLYAWKEQRIQRVNGISVFADRPRGKFGTTTGGTVEGDLGPVMNAAEMTKTGGVYIQTPGPISPGTYAWIELGFDDKRPPNLVWVFTTPIISTVPLKLLDICGTSLSTGAARYKAGIGTGTVSALDPTTNYAPPDSAVTYASPFNAFFVNEFEGGSAATGTHILSTEAASSGNGAIVWGFWRGETQAVDGVIYPVLYGNRGPVGTHFKVLLTPYSGSPTPPNIGYNTTTLTGLPLASNIQPDYRDGWQNLSPASGGTGYIDQTGTFRLHYADEPFTSITECG